MFFAFSFFVRHEDQFLISGLTRPPPGLTSVEWQNRVKLDVGGVVTILLGRECPIEVVHNQTGPKKVTSYLVKMRSAQDAKDVRSTFGSFFKGGQDGRPAALRSVSVSNWTTPGTKVRLAVLKVLAARYRASNPGSRVQVCGCSLLNDFLHVNSVTVKSLS